MIQLLRPLLPFRETKYSILEIQWWSQATLKLNAFRDTYSNPATVDAMARVNRAISAWPDVSGENGEPPAAIETVKATYKKLSSGLTEIKESADLEIKYGDHLLVFVTYSVNKLIFYGGQLMRLWNLFRS